MRRPSDICHCASSVPASESAGFPVSVRVPRKTATHCHGTRFCDFLRRNARPRDTARKHDTARHRARTHASSHPRNRRARRFLDGLAETHPLPSCHTVSADFRLAQSGRPSLVYLPRACNGGYGVILGRALRHGEARSNLVRIRFRDICSSDHARNECGPSVNSRRHRRRSLTRN